MGDFILFSILLNVFLLEDSTPYVVAIPSDQSKHDGQRRNQKNRYAYEHGTAKKELLRKHKNDWIGIGVKQPIALAREEQLMESRKCAAKINSTRDRHKPKERKS